MLALLSLIPPVMWSPPPTGARAPYPAGRPGKSAPLLVESRSRRVVPSARRAFSIPNKKPRCGCCHNAAFIDNTLNQRNDMSPQIRSEMKLVTPELAKEYLLSNEQNRRIRSGWVNYLAYCIRNNEWKMTHQGIAFSNHGRLLDGQHRLMGIVKANIPAMLMVSYGWDESVFSAIDNGMRRSDEDRTNIPRRLAECAKFFLQIMDYAGFESPPSRLRKGLGGNRSTPEQIIAYAHVISDFENLLIKHCASSSTLFSTVPSRCAVIANMMLGDDIDYLLSLYRDLVLGKTENLPPIARSAVQQFLTGTFNSRGGGEIRIENFIRFLSLFRKKNEKVQKLILRDCDERLAQVKKDLLPWFARKEQANQPSSALSHLAKTEQQANTSTPTFAP